MRRAVLATVLGGGIPSVLPQMVTVCCGNSISVQSQWNPTSSSAWITKGELQLANMLAGAPMRFKRITASTRTDRYGVYGYSGQTLATINSDIDLQWFSPLDTGSVTPDLVVGLALTENSISLGATFSAIQSDVETWLSKIRTKWPQAKILLCTPRPSISNNTGAIVTVYQQVRDYILAKDDRKHIFVARLDSYENQSSPGTPQITTITGSISTTTLTVTATDGPIGIGAKLFGSGVSTAIVTSYGTGRGGTGTYGISVSQTVASQSMSVSVNTDEAVHPNAKGALVNARIIAACLQRIARSFSVPYAKQSSNQFLTGSAAASGTNVSGTVPTSTTISGSAGGTFVGAALQPGLEETISGVATVTSSNTPVDLTSTNFGAQSLSSVTQISPYIKIQLVSGAANLSFLQFMPRVNDGNGNNFQNYITQNTNDAEPDWQDGDVLTCVCPPLIAAAGSISAATNYIGAKMKLNQDSGGTVKFRVLEQGIQTVA